MPIDPTSRVHHPDPPGHGTRQPTGATERAELEPGSDAALLADGWATLTPLAGVREDTSERADAALAAALATYRPGVLDGRLSGTRSAGGGRPSPESASSSQSKVTWADSRMLSAWQWAEAPSSAGRAPG